MFLEFAYTHKMQSIHAINAFVTNTLIMYFIADLLLKLFDEKASIMRRCTFAFITGALFNTAYVYVIYIISGALSFSPIIYRLLTTPNPIFALLYCIIGIKILKLSPIRSIKLMGYLYLFYLLIINFNATFAPILFAQKAERYNYLLAMLKQSTFFLTALIAFWVAPHISQKKKYLIRFSDKIFINSKKELVLFFFRVSIFYIMAVSLPSLISNQILANFLVMLILSLFLALTIYIDVNDFQKAEIENKEIHISALSKGMSEFSGVKHDFYNILQTYGGYLAIGDLNRLREYHSSLLKLTKDAGSFMELGERMAENPALISLLISKSDYAKEMKVQMKTSMLSSIDTLYIDSLDICRCLACLLDNAIEAAAESEQKKVFFTIENKSGGSKLIIITNTTSSPVDVNKIILKGFTGKQGHSGLGLSNIHSIIETHGNCTFQIGYYNYEFSAYIELRKN